MTVGDWRKLEQTHKEQEAFLSFVNYWWGVRDSISMFVEEKDKDAAKAIISMLIINTQVSSLQFVEKVNEYSKDAKEDDEIAKYIYQANMYYLTKAAKKLPIVPEKEEKPKMRVPNGPKISL